MTLQEPETPQEDQAVDTQEETPPAGALSAENMIPQSRFNQVNDRMKAAEDELAKMQQENQQTRDAKLIEQNRWQEIAESKTAELETANLKAARTDELEAIMLQTLEAQIETIPENMRSIVPSHGTPQERLAWINENAAKLALPQAPDLGGGAGSNNKPEKKIELSHGEQHLAEQARAYGFNIESESVARRKKK